MDPERAGYKTSPHEIFMGLYPIPPPKFSSEIFSLKVFKGFYEVFKGEEHDKKCYRFFPKTAMGFPKNIFIGFSQKQQWVFLNNNRGRKVFSQKEWVFPRWMQRAEESPEGLQRIFLRFFKNSIFS